MMLFKKKKQKVMNHTVSEVNDYAFANILTAKKLPTYDVSFLEIEDAISQASLLLNNTQPEIINKSFFNANLEILKEKALAEFDRQEQAHKVWISDQLIAIGSEKIRVLDQKKHYAAILDIEDEPLPEILHSPKEEVEKQEEEISNNEGGTI